MCCGIKDDYGNRKQDVQSDASQAAAVAHR